MLIHTLRGLEERAVITHVPSRAQMTIQVAMNSDAMWAAYREDYAAAPPFLADEKWGGEGWRHYWCHGDMVSARVSYVQRTQHEGLPSFEIQGAKHLFAVHFHVTKNHPRLTRKKAV